MLNGQKHDVGHNPRQNGHFIPSNCILWGSKNTRELLQRLLEIKKKVELYENEIENINAVMEIAVIETFSILLVKRK